MKARWSATAVPSANRSVKRQLRDYLAANQPAAITEADEGRKKFLLATAAVVRRELIKVLGVMGITVPPVM